MALPACASRHPPETTAATTTERGREIIRAPFALFKHIQQSVEKARLFLSLPGILGGWLRLLRRRGLGALRRLRRGLARGTPGYRSGNRLAIAARTGDLRQCLRGFRGGASPAGRGAGLGARPAGLPLREPSGHRRPNRRFAAVSPRLPRRAVQRRPAAAYPSPP